MVVIQEVIDDAKKMPRKDNNVAIEERNNDEMVKKVVGDLNPAEMSKEAALLELEELSNHNAKLHQEGDFVMKNFEIKQDLELKEHGGR